MIDLLFFFTPVVANAAPKKDYVGLVAAEAAYVALLPDAAPVDPQPVTPDPNCPTCRGVGKVPSGDGQGWSKCPTCMTPNPRDAAPALPVAPGEKTPKSDPHRYRTSQ